jgi:hypothetical protein
MPRQVHRFQALWPCSLTSGQVQAQIDDISRRLSELKFDDITSENIRYALESKFASGDPEKTIELLRIQQQSFAGVIAPYDPNVCMVGAENREGVTCYLDALLFAMFAKLEHYESMLKNDLPDEKQRNLAALLRLWVNMLRTGKMIHTDLTEHIQDALANCGWQDARLLEQQDTSEAFAFITDQLQLPLLSLQVDMFHQGKSDKDDHKVVQERLLNLAVPADPDGRGIKLEDCLEDYFNTKVDIMRDSLVEKNPHGLSLSPEDTIRIVTAEEDGEANDLMASPVQMQHTPLRRTTSAGETSQATTSESQPGTRPAPRHRATSIIQRIIVDEQGKPHETSASASDPATLLQRARRTGSTVVKAVTVPSWMFSRLIPWHSLTNSSEPKSDADVARHFNQRPVVGICLKRYMLAADGLPERHNTFIDIPDSLRLPHFMMVDDMKVEQEPYGLSSEYKLVLQSVVCHRGPSLHTGHYVSFARVAPKLLTENRRHDSDPPPDYEEAQWVKFDDILEPEDRVSYVDDIRQALREEMPYLLFYQILPVVDITAASTDGSVAEPPSYDDAHLFETVPQTPTLEPEIAEPLEAISRSTSGYFESLPQSNGPSLRLSSEVEPRVRLSFDEDPYSSGSFLNVNGSRRQSITFSESALATPAITPDQATPADDVVNTRLSRAAARFTKKETKSRPTSQAGENRISVTISRLSTLMRTSKEPLRDAVQPGDDGIVIVESEGAEDTNGKPKENEKEHHHHHHRKEKIRSKKEKGKSKEKEDNEPERECVVM